MFTFLILLSNIIHRLLLAACEKPLNHTALEFTETKFKVIIAYRLRDHLATKNLNFRWDLIGFAEVVLYGGAGT